jgi:hypothetical protein
VSPEMQQILKNQFPRNILIIAILFLGSIYLFHDSMSLPPAYMHSWTQSDRLAIAMNFQENGFDFFHPATYNLLTKDGITQVDFPIHDYLIAIISAVSGLELSLSFRLYNLIFFLIGLFYFFRACQLLNIEGLLAFAATIFISTLPFLVYYENGFLPSNPSYASFCIALYFLIKSETTDQRASYGIAVGFLTLAALARIPFSIFLIALIAAWGYKGLEQKKIRIKELFFPILGLGLVFAYFLYNQHLASKYGSMFLSTFRYAESGEALWQTISASLERWSGQILSPYHLVLLVALILIYLIAPRAKTKSEKLKILEPFGLIASIGVVFYFALMSLQFIDHDYYYIDSFLPLFSLFLLFTLRKIKLSDRWYTPAFAFILICSFGMYAYARSNQDYRYGDFEKERAYYHYQLFERSAENLDDWGVKADDTLAVFDIGSTNLPFISWQKRGYTSTSSGKEQAKELLGRNFDFALLIDSFKVSDSYFDYPEIARQLKYLDGNGEVSVYRKHRSESKGQFFKALHADLYLDFDSMHQSGPLKVNEGAGRSMLDDMMGNSLKISDRSEFALTVEYAGKLDHSSRLSLQFEIFPADSAKGLQLVVSAGNYRYAYYLENEVEEFEQWQKLQFHRRIPAKYLNDDSKPLKVYFWNPKGSLVYIDNYEILLYE